LSDAFLPGSEFQWGGWRSKAVAANQIARSTKATLNLAAQSPAVLITGTRSLATSTCQQCIDMGLVARGEACIRPLAFASLVPNLRVTMGNCTRKQAQLLLAFKVLHFVNQLRKRVKIRMQGGFDDDPLLGNYLQADRKALRRTSGLARLGARDAKQPQHIANRISKCRKNNQKSFRPVLRLRTSGSGDPVCSNESGEEVQQYVERSFRLVSCMLSSVNSGPSNAEAALTTIASDNKLFLRHGNSPTLQRCSLNELSWFLVATFSALQTLSTCRSQFGDNWLAAHGQDIGLDVDETFVANLEHLLLRLQAELENALKRKRLDELLHPTGRYDKNQRRLLACSNEWAEKPQPLSMSFPWTIKPSLAVLWGVSSSLSRSR
jgi:hypothetical protein